MSSLRAASLVLRVAAVLPAASCAPPPVEARELRLTDQRFEHDAFFEVDRLVLASGAHVRVERGALLMIRTRELVLEGPALFDGDGAAGARPETYTSQLSGLSCERAHADWEIARVTQERDRGGAGGPGGHVELRYHRVTESGGALAELRFATAAGPGAEGRRFRCGCYVLDPAHAAHVKIGPRGRDGAPGSARVIYEPEAP